MTNNLKSYLLLLAIATGLSTGSLVLIQPVVAKCSIWEKVDPTNPNCHIIPKGISETLWGEAGTSGYQAAAQWQISNNGHSQGLDDLQKQYLRPYYGDLVDRVSVNYNANLADEWGAFGKTIHVGGVESTAQTYCQRIYFNNPYQRGNRNDLITLGHELTHAKQCEQLGGLGKFGYHYFVEYKKANLNYNNNKLEQEAYAFENKFASSLPEDIAINPDPNPLPPILSAGRYRLDQTGAIYYANGDNHYCWYQSWGDYVRLTGGVRDWKSIPSISSLGIYDGVCRG